MYFTYKTNVMVEYIITLVSRMNLISIIFIIIVLIIVLIMINNNSKYFN